VSRELLKFTVICVDTLCQSLTLIYRIIQHAVLGIQPISQQTADAAGTNVVLFGRNWCANQIIL